MVDNYREIDDVEKIYKLCIEKDERIAQLERQLGKLIPIVAESEYCAQDLFDIEEAECTANCKACITKSTKEIK